MKKSYLILLVVCLATTSIFAQRWSKQKDTKFYLGVLGGFNLPRLTGGGGNPLSEGWSSREGYAFGLTGTFKIGTHFDIQVEALFSNEGGKHYGMQAVDTTPVSAAKLQPNHLSFKQLGVNSRFFYANFHNESILNYIEIPVMAKYNISLGNSSSFYIDFGPYVGFLVNAKQKIKGSSLLYLDQGGTVSVPFIPEIPFDTLATVTSRINPINFGITGGVGISHKLGIGIISLDVRGAYGLTNIQKYKSDGSNHIGNLLAAVGYAIPLKKR